MESSRNQQRRVGFRGADREEQRPSESLGAALGTQQMHLSRSFSQVYETSQGHFFGQNGPGQYIDSAERQSNHGLNLSGTPQQYLSDSFTGQANLTRVRLPPIQNIGGRTNVTQVDQTRTDYEQKTERSLIPCLITKENKQITDQDISKDKDQTILSRRLNITQLNTADSIANREEQIETDRKMIQQIIYQNHIPTLDQNAAATDSVDPVTPQRGHRPAIDASAFCPSLELTNLAMGANVNEFSQKEESDGSDVAREGENRQGCPVVGTHVNPHQQTQTAHPRDSSPFGPNQQQTRRQQTRSNSLILNGSQISFRAPALNHQPISSSTTQLAFSSLVSQQNQNLQRQQQQLTRVPNFGELGRLSLEEEERDEGQNVEEQHFNQVAESTAQDITDSQQQNQQSVFDNMQSQRPRELGLRFIRSRTPIRINRQNIQQQLNNQITNNAENEVIRTSRFQDGGYQQLNDASPSSSGSRNTDRSRVRSLDINYNQFFGAIQSGDISNTNGLQRQSDQNLNSNGGHAIFNSIQSVQQRSLNRYQSYTGLRSVAHQQNMIHLNRRHRPSFLNSRQVRGHFNTFVNHFTRESSQALRHGNSGSNETGLQRASGQLDNNIYHPDDLNFGDIDILEDELRRSNHNNAGGLLVPNFNQLDSSIQNFGSSQQDGMTPHQSRQEELIEQNEAQSVQGRNMTLSRMLHFYRNRRSLNQHRIIRSGASDNGADHFVPRTLTQNFMNNEGEGSGGLGLADRNSFGMLSHSVLRSQTINRRSENFRQNQPIGGLYDNHVNLPPARITNLRNNDTHTIQENIEHLDLLDALSNNQNDNGGARYTPQETRNQRRPMSRAAGFDSRQQQSQNVLPNSSQQQNDFLAAQFFASPNTSSNQTHNGAAGLTLFPRTGGTNIQSLEQLRPSPIDMSADQTHQQNQALQEELDGQQLNPEQRQRQNRRARYLQIFRTRIPTFDENFMSRSETQIQNQLYQRGVGLPPRLTRQNQAGLLRVPGTNYSYGNLPTLNEVNEQNLFRDYRSGGRPYDTSVRPFPEDNSEQIGNNQNQLRDDRTEDNNHQSPPIGRERQREPVPSSSDDTYQMQGTDSISYRYIQSQTQSRDSSSSQNVPVDDRVGATGNQWRNRVNNVRTRISPGVRRRRNILNRRNNDDSYIGRGTRYLRTFNQMRSQAQRQVRESLLPNISSPDDAESPMTRQGGPMNQVINYNQQAEDNDSSNDDDAYLNSPMFQDKRSKLKLVKIYNKLKPYIPKEWRIEELSRDIVTQQDYCITYLESYGPLALLIYLRTQKLVKAERKQQESLNFETGFEEFVYASMNELSYCNYGRCHDYIKFLVKVIQFYQGNLELAVDYKSQEAFTKLKKFLTKILPSCKELKKILKQKRKNTDKKQKKNKTTFGNNEFSIYEENIIYIVILLIMESFYLQFDSEASCVVKSKHKVKRVASAYEKQFLPLALEFYTHHVQSSDLVLLNSLLSFNNFGPTGGDSGNGGASNINRPRGMNSNDDISESIFQAKQKERNTSMLILNYFPNLKQRYASLPEGNRIDLQKYDVQDRVDYYLQEQMRLRNSEHMDEEASYFHSNCKDISGGGHVSISAQDDHNRGRLSLTTALGTGKRQSIIDLEEANY